MLNLVGQVLPLAIGLVVIPILVRDLGVERFGVLALIWLIVGYFSLFDFGLGKAITLVVAKKFGSDEEHEISRVVWTGASLLGALGLLVLLVLFFSSDWLVTSVFQISAEFRTEAGQSIALLGISVPLVLVSIGLRGVLEAFQQFKFITLVRVPVGIWNFVGPLIALGIADDLRLVVIFLLFGRALAFVLFFLRCTHIVSPPSIANLSRSATNSILKVGGWLAVSNIVGPLTAFLDRFVVAAMLPISAVAYYTTPHQIVTRVLIVPAAILAAFFPAFATISKSSPIDSYRLLRRATLYIVTFVGPIVFVVVAFAEPLISIWIGPEFAANSFEVTRLLGVAVLINCVGIVAQMYIQAIGRPDITAKFSLIELPVFATYLVVLVDGFGIIGAGIAWIIRVTISTVLLSILANLLTHGPLKEEV